MIYFDSVKMTQGEYEKYCRENHTEDAYRDPKETWEYLRKHIGGEYRYVQYGSDEYIDAIAVIADNAGLNYEELFNKYVSLRSVVECNRGRVWT